LFLTLYLVVGASLAADVVLIVLLFAGW